MHRISDLHAARQAGDRPVISFEFFTPKTEAGDVKLMEVTMPALLELAPDYVSVTYGAGGTTRTKTLTLVDAIQKQFDLTTMAHLTCVGHTRDEIAAILDEAKALGIRNILALRGDPPAGESEFSKPEGGFEFSYQLVDFIRKHGGDFCIGTAGFPEGHLACADGKLADWGYLKQKVDAGADFVLTQLFFDNADFFAFRDHMVNELGVTVPICPGILPILSSKQITRFTQLCGARMPMALQTRLEDLADDDAGATAFGIEYATRQCEELIREGVPGLHLYSLNKAHSVSAILGNLGLDHR
ncbi:MAG TPA: methylenetetrahydrofolate reductase [NAD(P)H] [Acidobacteria bacterium]|nr:methylenetetrahydrofolate reductase [NAD(P)H] [Acidobacteriota bacterium]HAK55710.1 methylenetetrahydrofolate reductase [NAD(P)H] [Acidobacteriota bacterium]